MGQIKNIKLHIVTDIKTMLRAIWSNNQLRKSSSVNHVSANHLSVNHFSGSLPKLKALDATDLIASETTSVELVDSDDTGKLDVPSDLLSCVRSTESQSSSDSKIDVSAIILSCVDELKIQPKSGSAQRISECASQEKKGLIAQETSEQPSVDLR